MHKPGSEMGAILRELRTDYKNPRRKKRCGISQIALAQKAGVGTNLVHYYESGALTPWVNLELILGALGYELEIVKK